MDPSTRTARTVLTGDRLLKDQLRQRGMIQLHVPSSPTPPWKWAGEPFAVREVLSLQTDLPATRTWHQPHTGRTEAMRAATERRVEECVVKNWSGCWSGIGRLAMKAR